MTLNFAYNEDKDIECLITKGPGSINSPGQKTKTYVRLSAYVDDITNPEKVREFVRKYLEEEKINPVESAQELKRNWDKIGREFEKRAEKVFGLHIEEDVTAFLTVAGRYPYSISGKYFFVSTNADRSNPIIMHELWHFYTYRKFGRHANEIGGKKFNDLKESLTVLLNIECQDLMSGQIDNGYVQHQRLRRDISSSWLETGDIEKVWEMALGVQTEAK